MSIKLEVPEVAGVPHLLRAPIIIKALQLALEQFGENTKYTAKHLVSWVKTLGEEINSKEAAYMLRWFGMKPVMRLNNLSYYNLTSDQVIIAIKIAQVPSIPATDRNIQLKHVRMDNIQEDIVKLENIRTGDLVVDRVGRSYLVVRNGNGPLYYRVLFQKNIKTLPLNVTVENIYIVLRNGNVIMRGKELEE